MLRVPVTVTILFAWLLGSTAVLADMVAAKAAIQNRDYETAYALWFEEA